MEVDREELKTTYRAILAELNAALEILRYMNDPMTPNDRMFAVGKLERIIRNIKKNILAKRKALLKE